MKILNRYAPLFLALSTSSAALCHASDSCPHGLHAKLKQELKEPQAHLSLYTKETITQTFQELIEFFKKTDYRILPNDKEHKNLYERFLRYKDDPYFLELLQSDSKALGLMEYSRLAPPVRSARDVLRYMDETGYTHYPVDPETYFYKREIYYRTHPEFIAELKKHPRAWQLFLERPQLVPTPAQTVAKKVLERIKELGYTRGLNRSDGQLYVRYLKHRESEELIYMLQQDPKAWELLKKR